MDIEQKINVREKFHHGRAFAKTDEEVYGDPFYHVVSGNRHIAIVGEALGESFLLRLDNRQPKHQRDREIIEAVHNVFFDDKWYKPKRKRIKFLPTASFRNAVKQETGSGFDTERLDAKSDTTTIGIPPCTSDEKAREIYFKHA